METRRCISRPLLLAALLVGAGLDIPAQAETDVEKLNNAVERLLKRVEQLEASSKRLEAALEKEEAAGHSTTPRVTKHQAATERAANEKVNDLDDRVEDLENQLVTLKKPNKLEEALEGVTVGTELAMVSQRAQRGATQGNKSQLNYRADVTVEVPLDSFGKLAGVGDSKLFFHLRAGQGEGLKFVSPIYTATPNSTAFFLEDGEDAATIVGEAWYQFGYPLAPTASGALPRIEGTFGKIDLFGFFDENEIADNENVVFLNNVFVHNPLLDSGGAIGGDSYGFQPGVIASYTIDVNSVNHWKASLGVFGSAGGAGFDSTFTKPLVIGQWEYGGRVLSNRPGHYRIYAWTNGQFVPYNDAVATTTGAADGLGLLDRPGSGPPFPHRVRPVWPLLQRPGPVQRRRHRRRAVERFQLGPPGGPDRARLRLAQYGLGVQVRRAHRLRLHSDRRGAGHRAVLRVADQQESPALAECAMDRPSRR